MAEIDLKFMKAGRKPQGSTLSAENTKRKKKNTQKKTKTKRGGFIYTEPVDYFPPELRKELLEGAKKEQRALARAKATKKTAKTKLAYREPAEYFPKDLRKKYKLGEYSDLPDFVGGSKTNKA